MNTRSRMNLTTLICVLVLVALPGQGLGQASDLIVAPNLRVSPGEFNEPWMAASPTNPNFLIAVTQNDGLSFGGRMGRSAERHSSAFLSRDGGIMWESIVLPGYEAGAFDPMVLPGPDGRMWILYTFIGGNTFDFADGERPARRSGTILVWSTTDEGETWEGPFELRAPVPPDHPRIAADWSDGPNRGRLYVVWNDVRDSFLKDEFQVFLHTLDNGGHSVSEPKLLAQIPGGKLVATEPVVLSDGTLLVTFYQYFFPLSDEKNREMPFFTMRSTDGGDTFSQPEVAFRIGHHSWPYAQSEMSSAFTLPIVQSDRTDGAHKDNIYIVWDQVSEDTSNIWFRRSTDGGRNWTTAMKLNDNLSSREGDPLDDRMLPVIEVNKNGVIGTAWYDRRNDGNRQCWELYFTSSSDGGQTFTPNARVSSQPSCPPPSYAPALRVHNLAVDPSVQDIPESEMSTMSLTERSAAELAQQVRHARDRYFGELDHGRLEVSFDNARGTQPGHYMGLAADAEGVFHPLWISRRNGLDELFTTTVEVMHGNADAEEASEADITRDILVLVGPASYNPANGTVTFDIQLRNTSDGIVRGPVRVRSMNGRSEEWSFDGRLGSHDRLPPGGLSEPMKVELEMKSGSDARLDFRVFGRRNSS
jgi:hypothetical protein